MPKSLAEAYFRANVGQIKLPLVDMRNASRCQCVHR
jgi:hypothetical protein